LVIPLNPEGMGSDTCVVASRVEDDTFFLSIRIAKFQKSRVSILEFLRSTPMSKVPIRDCTGISNNCSQVERNRCDSKVIRIAGIYGKIAAKSLKITETLHMLLL